MRRDLLRAATRLNCAAPGLRNMTDSRAGMLRQSERARDRAPGNTRRREKGLANHPVTDVSWDDSLAYAKWAGCELASEAQWERACRGPLGLAYPWGEDWDATKSRHDKKKGGAQTSRGDGS